METATATVSPLAAVMLGIVIAVVSGAIVSAVSVFWFGRLDRRQAELERKVEGDLERRLQHVEGNADPERNGRIDQQLTTIGRQMNHVEGQVETIVGRQAEIAADVRNNADYVRAVSSKIDRTAERLERRVETLEARR